jgi:RNA polymerase sigma factor (sigma-70 family)
MARPLLFLNDDARLLDGIRSGDEEALVTLYRRAEPQVRALVMRNSGTLQDGQEILQEALVILWERVRAGRYEHAARCETFLFATARNLWLRRLARRRREVPDLPDGDTVAAADPDPLESMIEDEQTRMIGNALMRLGEPCRTLLLLFYWEEVPMEEIARRLGFANAATAKSKKYQCKKTLQALMGERGGDRD